jgi:glutamate formiminotransferase
VLAVPNCSEGRDPDILARLADACRVPGARLLDVNADPDHNRSVYTIAGHPMAVQDALVSLAAAAREEIDLRWQRGAHPRLGALDVAPVVAVAPGDEPLAREVALGLAERIGWELHLPVFLYGAVASDPARTRPFHFRALGLEGIGRMMDEGELQPDAGPARLDPTAGCVLVGVRPPLIAWNVDLPEATLAEARAIADRVRERGGGPPGVRALGLYLPDRGIAQLSMNLEDTRGTPPAAVMRAVRREADRLGVALGPSELVGLMPRHALRGTTPAALGLPRFTPAQVLEARCPGLRRD